MKKILYITLIIVFFTIFILANLYKGVGSDFSSIFSINNIFKIFIFSLIGGIIYLIINYFKNGNDENS